MLDHLYNLEEKRRLVDQLLARANAYLSGKAGPIETSRSFLRFCGKDQELDKFLVTFQAVESETDALPLGTVREFWNPSALKREDVEIAKAEAIYCEPVANACRDLIRVLSPLLDALQDQSPDSRGY